MSLTFAQAQLIVATSLGVVPEKLGSLTSRIKQWQKMGFPEGTSGLGKGVKASYGAAQIFQLLLMARLLKLGVTPERAKLIIESRWDQFRHGILRALIAHGSEDTDRHYYAIQMDALTELTSPDADGMLMVVNTISSADLKTAWDPLDDAAPEDERTEAFYRAFLVKNRLIGALVIEVDSLLYWVWFCMREMGVSPAIFAEEFEAWHGEVWAGFEDEQRDDDEFLALRNRSAVEHDIGKLDLTEPAREAFSLVLHKYIHGER